MSSSTFHPLDVEIGDVALNVLRDCLTDSVGYLSRPDSELRAIRMKRPPSLIAFLPAVELKLTQPSSLVIDREGLVRFLHFFEDLLI